ncbi:glycerol-3-phosphate 1-O-acyltransferase PlsY [Novosphingobium profundi]|uniref:glycerol-3-phosphate 1-O-acyltransferase PlsY n=1 Tax=Novosphingobium profundi TaxID=1774954 RepID=UPI001BD9EFF8|nr:glycerol-3-phosphate 1-O-acyltransferase PlsY [Novosphingobium profundi]MBT0667524.1 glycerol-3-phosphate 1-O-acyltransferase PlsY [Novosphingobium profundi]
MDWILALFVGYGFGSVPFGLLLTQLAGMEDLRGIGSGNIGATNVLRTGNKKLAAATLLLDLGKGFAAVSMTAALWPQWTWLTALAVFVGHCFPVWLKFKGGKGVATTAGIAFAYAWPIGLAYAVAWIGLLAVVRISSVAGMSAAVIAPLVALALGQSEAAMVLGVIALVVLFQHRANIARLVAGTEPKVGAKK